MIQRANFLVRKLQRSLQLGRLLGAEVRLHQPRMIIVVVGVLFQQCLQEVNRFCIAILLLEVFDQP